MFEFFVRAKKSNSLAHIDVPVEIYIMGAADQPPVFERDLYRFSVVEDCAVSTAVGSVLAHSNGSIMYRFVSDSELHDDFVVNSSGDIVTMNQLDRETREMYELVLRAETRASPPLVAHTRVLIHVGDTNDNAPQFETDQYTAVIAEGSSPGTQVIQVAAEDPDLGLNGQFYYLMTNESVPGMFVCDSTSGSISVTGELDRELVTEYRMIVVAVDRGAPRMSSMTEVVVSVSDENDNAPVFVHSSYSGAVNEDALPGTIILVVMATDADVTPNNKVTYHIAGGDVLGQFGIRKSGEIYVNKPLDREEEAHYQLTVLATDGAYVATATVTINILDANDNAPVCEQVGATFIAFDLTYYLVFISPLVEQF